MPRQLPALGWRPGGRPGNQTRHCPGGGRCPGGTRKRDRSSSSLTTTTRAVRGGARWTTTGVHALTARVSVMKFKYLLRTITSCSPAIRMSGTLPGRRTRTRSGHVASRDREWRDPAHNGSVIVGESAAPWHESFWIPGAFVVVLPDGRTTLTTEDRAWGFGRCS